MAAADNERSAVLSVEVLKTGAKSPVNTYLGMLKRDFIINKYVYMIAIPVILFYIIFHYVPMYGALIAFKKYDIAKGFLNSPWVGFKYFNDFFSSIYFWRVIKNTLVISLSSLIWGFPMPIIFALLLNEIKNQAFSRTLQTITYLPHFISTVIIAGLIREFVAKDGLITGIFAALGGEQVNMLSRKEYFVPIFVSSGIWQELGWQSIIYLAALSGIDLQQYEAAIMDGANRWKRLWHITIPGILPTVIILLILRLGHIMSVGFEKIILLYNPAIYDTSDVISTFVYRKGLTGSFEFSYSSAVGLFNSVINFLMLVMSNWLSRKVSETSLW